MINDIVKLLTVLSMFLQVSFDILQCRWDIDLHFYTCDDRIKWKNHLCGSWNFTMLWITTWWYHGMEMIFALLVLCEENPTVVPGGFYHKKVLMQRFHLFLLSVWIRCWTMGLLMIWDITLMTISWASNILYYCFLQHHCGIFTMVCHIIHGHYSRLIVWRM